jgi:hypothetical protein
MLSSSLGETTMFIRGAVGGNCGRLARSASQAVKTGLGICQHAELPLSAWSRSNSYWDSTEWSDYGLFDIRHPVLVEYARSLLTDEVHSGPQGDVLTGETGQSGTDLVPTSVRLTTRLPVRAFYE